MFWKTLTNRTTGRVGRQAGKTWRLGRFVEDGGVRGDTQNQAPVDGLGVDKRQSQDIDKEPPRPASISSIRVGLK